MTWNEILSRDLVGVQVEIGDRLDNYRGPIASVSRIGSIIWFKLEWCARRGPSTNHKWSRSDKLEFCVEDKVTPNDGGHGTVTFMPPFREPWTIFAKESPRLDLREVLEKAPLPSPICFPS